MASDISGRRDIRWDQYDQDNQPEQDTLSFFSPPLLRVCDTTSASSSNMDGRSTRGWEDMDKDCLVNIFSRVPTPDLLMWVSLVCKAWHQASLDPQCWRRLDFRRASPTRRSGLLRLAVSRSQGHATVVMMPFARSYYDSFEPQDLDFIVGELKGLQILFCGRVSEEINQLHLADVIGNWPDLEGFSVGEDQCHLPQTLAAVARSCPRFHQLQLFDMILRPEAAAAVAEHLGPRLTYLSLANLFIIKDDLLLLLRACKRLHHLDVKDCRGFPSADPDVMNLGAGVRKFVYKPYQNRFDDEEWEHGISMSDVYDGNSDDGYEL